MKLIFSPHWEEWMPFWLIPIKLYRAVETPAPTTVQPDIKECYERNIKEIQ